MTTKEKAEIMLAHTAGAEVESKLIERSDDFFVSEPEPYWNWGTRIYRLKPREPRRIWANQCEGRKPECYETKTEAISKACRNCKTTEFVEVMKP
jgi:hypothetical protein